MLHQWGNEVLKGKGGAWTRKTRDDTWRELEVRDSGPTWG